MQEGTVVEGSKMRYKVVREAMRRKKLVVTTDDATAPLFWWDGNMSYSAYNLARNAKRINKIPGMDVICYKSTFFSSLNQMQMLFPQAYTFFPKSFFLPYQYLDLQHEHLFLLAKANDNHTWILKPQSGCCGNGIQLIQDALQLANYAAPAIVQKYITPYLLDGYKFDFRFYLVITTIHPFQAFLYHEGLCRFCTKKYTPPTRKNLSEKFCHITNTSVNVDNPNSTIDFTRLASGVLSDIAKSNVNAYNLWDKIAHACALSLIAIYPEILTNISKIRTEGVNRYFHVCGIDILLDSALTPTVLEINDRPSMVATFKVEEELKPQLVCDVLDLVNLEGTPVHFPANCWTELFPEQDSVLRMMIARAANLVSPNQRPKGLLDKQRPKEIIAPSIKRIKKRLSKGKKKRHSRFKE